MENDGEAPAAGLPAVPPVPGVTASADASTSRHADSDDDGSLPTPQYTPRGSIRSSTVKHSPVKHQPARHRVRHRKQRQGQTIYKGHPSWKMMVNIKLGIAYSVGRSAVANAQRALTSKDFRTIYRQDFPKEGSSVTQAHSSDYFEFTDHAPLAFRQLREHFGVSPEDYMISICGDSSLRELGTPGKSGAVFYLTEDGKYMIKTVSRKESHFLCAPLLPPHRAYFLTLPL